MHIARTHPGKLHVLRILPIALAPGASLLAGCEPDDREGARRLLGPLEQHLESIFFRGGIVLEGSDLDPGTRRSRD